jgi:outer membrane protein
MKKLVCFVFVALASADLASAQLKIAIINSQKALLETEEIKKAQKDLEAKFKPRQDQMAKLEKDLQDIQAQLQSGKLNQLGEQEMTAQGQRKQRELQRVQQDLQEDVERERNDILLRAGTRMQEVVKKVSEEKGLDLVIDSANTHFFKPNLDITEDAVAGYNKTYPVKSP